MKQLLLAGLLGGLAAFVWVGISWMALPWHESSFHTLPDGEAVVESLGARGLSTGVYHYPGLPEAAEGAARTDTDRRALAERYRRGPNINLLVYSTRGAELFAPRQFLAGLALNVAAATLAAGLLALTGGQLVRYRHRVGFVAALGVFATLVSHLASWNWGLFPADYTLAMVQDHVVGWLLAGCVIAWKLKPGVTARIAPERAQNT